MLVKKKKLVKKNTVISKNTVIKKEPTMFWPSILSRHPSHNVLRKALPKMSVRSVIRFGSETTINDGKKRIEINTVEAVRNSASKLRMKQKFTEAGVKTAEWIDGNSGKDSVIKWCSDKYPVIAKGIFGSRGRANTKIDNLEQLKTFLNNKNIHNYIFEAFFDGVREYRFHVTEDGVFLTWRKLRRNDTPDNQRWFFNNSNCNWVSEKHELYNRPKTYDLIAKECVKALNAVGLNIGGCDVRVNKNGEFKIIEINSACSLAEQTAEAYKSALITILKNKINKQ